MCEEATFRNTHLPQPTTHEFNDFVFSRGLISPTPLKSNAKERYPCKFCYSKFFCKTALSQHLLAHKSDSTYKSGKGPEIFKVSFSCQVCNLDFNQESTFQMHSLIHKNKESQLISEELFEQSVKNTDIHKNSLTHTNHNQFVCSVCNKKFICKEDYNAHCKTHSIKVPKNKKIACNVCSRKFSTKGNLTNHLKTHINVCVLGGKDSNNKKGIEEFENKAGDKYFYILGGKEVKDKTRCKDETEGKNFKDTAGGEEFKDKARCIDFKIMSGGIEIKDKTRNNDLTNKAVSKNFICDVCNKSYKLKIAFMSHKMSHVSAKPVCEVCHKQFKSNKLLKLHFRSHSDVRFFFCELCNKGFKHKHHLRTHFITHTDELPFVCEVCNKGFKHKWGLKQHAHMHTNKLSFVCEVCGKSFDQVDDLTKHSAAHVKELSEEEDCGRGIEMLTAKDKLDREIVFEACKIECSEEVVEHNKGSSHEILMETNKDESYQDIAIETCKLKCSQES